jgi:hypothetical protein
MQAMKIYCLLDASNSVVETNCTRANNSHVETVKYLIKNYSILILIDIKHFIY